MEIAKAIALGADLAGLALPFLRAADESDAAVDALIDELVTAPADRDVRDRLAQPRATARRPGLTEGNAPCSAAILLAAALASPSPSPSPTPAPLPAIGSVTVVSGSPQSLHRAPQAASVLDARTLRGSTAPALDGALRALPGLDRNRSNAPFTNYGQLRLSFAGAGSDRGALFVDGIPAQDGFGGQVDWNAYPAESVVRAELLRGPGRRSTARARSAGCWR